MRSITAFLFLFLFCSAVKAQYDVTPGVGIDKALLGMPVKEITSIIGEPSKVIGYGQERTDWINFGYDVTKRKLVFDIPFDHVYIFNDAKNIYSIWKIYTRNDTAVIFNLSSYQSQKEFTNKITISNELRFYDDSMAVKKVMGDEFVWYVDEAKNNHVIYKDKGIFFIVNNNMLRNVFLFMTPQQKPTLIPACPDIQYL